VSAWPLPHPHPTDSCGFTTADSLAPLVDGADLIVEATSPTGIPHLGATSSAAVVAGSVEYDFRGGIDPLDQRPVGPFTVFVDAFPLQIGHRYVFLLYAVPTLNTASGSPAYGPENGPHGTFDVTGGRVSSLCANYDDPSAPSSAPGSGMPLADFVRLLGRSNHS
jgi:hypothetical protein